MPYIIIPGFKGGQTQNLYDPIENQTYQNAQDLDVYIDKNILKPHKLKFTDMTLPTIAGGTEIVVSNSFKASDGKLYVVGSATVAATNKFVLWSTPTIQASPTWTADYNATSGSPGSPLDEFQDGLYFSEGTNFDRWGNLSGTPSRSNIGALDTVASYIRTHPGLGKIFAVHGRKIASYDGSTFTAQALLVDRRYTIVGIEPYEKWMIVGLKGAGSNRSVFLMWNGTDTTVDDIIEIGDVGLQAFKIVNGEIRYVSLTYTATGGVDFIHLSKVRPGGIPQLIDKRQYSVTSGSGSVNANASSNFGDLFFYGFNGETYDFSLGIYAYGSGDGKYSLFTLWRLLTGGITSAVSIKSIQHNGDNLVVIWSTQSGGGTQKISALYLSGTSLASPASGIYESNAFALNAGLEGKIKRIIILHEPLASSCGFTVQVKHYGHYPWGTSIPAEDSYADLVTPNGSGGSTGKTQSTDNAVMTEIAGNELFKDARYGQLKIKYDEVSGVNTPGIIFPIIIEV